MAVLTRFAAVLALCAGGCTLYFESEGDDEPGGGGGSGGGGGQGGNGQRLAMPCIHEVAGGDLQSTVADTLLTIRACEGGPIVSSVYRENGQLLEYQPLADWNTQYRHAKLVDIDDTPYEILATADDGLGAGVFHFGYLPPGWSQWHRMDLSRRFEDIAAITRVGPWETHWAVAGDGALRELNVMQSSMSERELLTGRPFLRVATTWLDETPGRDLFYIARSPAGFTLGDAYASATTPPTYTERVIAEHSGDGEPLGLLIADVDDDGVPDVIGATPEVFVRSSRFDAVFFLGQSASRVATGDIEGDGMAEILFLTEDGSAVHRVDVLLGPTDIALQARPWLLEGGEQLVVADLDGDTHDDVILLRDTSLASSYLAYFRSP